MLRTKLVIFGITGDLSKRKLLPALEQIINTGKFDDLSIIGVSRQELHLDELLRQSIGENSLEGRTSGFSMDVSNLDDYIRLKDFIDLQDDEQAIIYLSVPPGASTQIIEMLGQAKINSLNVKLLLEKPFGIDLASAHDMIEHVAKYYQESQVYRIDHYLAKEMSQNIMTFRGGNALFDHVWDNKSIEKIEISALESIGIEGRAHFYEQTGALRDLVQGHLMQLLAIILMETPEDFDWNDVPSLRLDALHKIAPADPEKAVRGQYIGYRDEVGNSDSITETFASITLASDHALWQGVPLILTTGKGLNEKETEVRVHFRKSHESQTNCLIFKIQPSEGVEIELNTKKPGYDREFETKKLSFSYPEDAVLPDAYEQVIVDAIRSRKSLFAGGDEVLRSWEILSAVQQKWVTGDDLRLYNSGSSPDDILRDTPHLA